MSQSRPTREEFRRTLWRASLPPLLLLAALAAFVSLLLFQLLRANTWAQQSEEVISRAKDLERLLINMETGVRGYILAGSDEFLEPYNRARANVDITFAELEKRLADNDGQVDRLHEVRRLLDQWLALEPEMRSLRSLAPADDAGLRLLRDRKRIMDDMRARVQEMVNNESTLSHQRYQSFQRASTLAVIGSIGLSISLGIGLALINRGTIIRLTTVYQQALEAEDTRANELETSNKQFLDLAEAIPQLVWISDGAGRAAYFNTPWGTFTGCSVAHLTEHGWEHALHPDDREAATRRWRQSLETGEPFEAEYRVKQGTDGGYRWFLCRATPVRDKSGKSVRWFGSCTDIESQKQVEHEREAVLAKERKARSDLLRTNQIKDQFLATLSHELRTPMTAILGWIQLLREPSVREKNLDRAIDAIDSNSRAQNRLIEDLLDMSRILSGKLTIKPGVVDLRQVVKSAIDAVGPAAIEKKVSIVQDILQPEDFKLSGDAARLQQVVSNLLSNAVKFTPAGGQVTVLLKRSDHTARVVVSDTGRGIRPEFIPYVFERFRQADGSTTRQHGGLGLGLAIVKHLVEMHGGHVIAHSEGEDRGATFTVELPLTAPVIVPPAPSDQNTAMAQPTSLKGVNILLVEDDRGAAEVVRTILEHAGATVDSASSAAAGLERVRERRYDVLISDIGMPDMDGYALIKKVRQMEDGLGRQLPAIALTAFANKDDREEALKAGYHMHLAKPVAPADLSRAVASVVGEVRTT